MSREADSHSALAARAELVAAKRRLSPAVLALPGVAGLGIQADEVVVYLADGSSDVREAVGRIIREQEPTIRWRWEVTGTFRPV